MNEWKQTTLGNCFDLVRNKVHPETLDSRYPYVGMEHIRPNTPKITATGTVGAINSQVGLFKRDDVLFGRLRAYLRKVAIAEHDGASSTEVLILRSRHAVVEPGFLYLLSSSEACIDYAVAMSAGSRMPRTSAADLSAFPIALPPPDEQRRIVDVMAAVEAQIEALTDELSKSRAVLRRTLSDHFEAISSCETRIVDLCSHVIGGVWGAAEGQAEVDVLALGPRIYASGTSDFVTDGSPIRSVTAKQAKSRLVQPNDIILERSGGSPEQPVGRVVIAGEGLAPCIPTDFQRLMRPDVDRVRPRYLFWRLQHDWNTGLTRAFSRRTTGITNLSVKDYISREISIPGDDEQDALVSVADGIDSVIRATEAELAHLRAFRSSFLTSLLNQEIEIPESYDAVLEEA